MAPKNPKSQASGTKRKSYNCLACKNKDNRQMVCCDDCDGWYHYACVGVTAAVANEDWRCESCSEPLAIEHTGAQHTHSASEKQASTNFGGGHTETSTEGAHGGEILQSPSLRYLHKAEDSLAVLSAPASTTIRCFTPSGKQAARGAARSTCSKMSKSSNISIRRLQAQMRFVQEEQSILQQKETLVKQKETLLQKQRDLVAQLEEEEEKDSESETDDDDKSCAHVETRLKGTCGTNSMPTGAPGAESTTAAQANIQRGDVDNNQANNVPTPQQQDPLLRQILEKLLALEEKCMANVKNDSSSEWLPGVIPINVTSATNANNATPSQNELRFTNRINADQLAARNGLSKELPKFMGKPEEWPIFIASYEQTTDLCGFSDHENLVRLRQALDGPARNAVKNLLLHASCVPQIISTLRMKFGRPELIIDTLLSQIREMPPPKESRPETLVEFAIEVQNICATMKTSGLLNHLNNPELEQELVSKLPGLLGPFWGMHKLTLSSTTLEDFSNWLFQLAQGANNIIVPSTSLRVRRRGTLNTHTELAEDASPKACVICRGNCSHVEICNAFSNLSRSERWRTLRANQLCRRCLRPHYPHACLSSATCGVDGCRFPHHPSLHRSTISTTASMPTHMNCNAHRHHHDPILFRVLPVTLYGRGVQISTFAFFDDGSSLTLIDEDLMAAFNLKGSPQPLCLQWTSNTHRYEVDEKKCWYLPVFPVSNPNKPGKLRLVWDAAAKVDGVSLNTMLLKGPDQLTSLVSALRKFRQRRVAIGGDIAEMYHQIRVREKDQNYQRFLWSEPGSQAPDAYVMMVMTFGASCSPSCAEYIKNKNAEEFRDQYPRAVRCILENHYVDDILDSVDTEEEAINLAREVHFIHSKGGFQMRNWVSNSKTVLNALNAQATDAVNLNASLELATEKVLGMWWSTADDFFSFQMSNRYRNDDVLLGNRRPTKREVLSLVMTIFDPLGLLGFYVMYAKIVFQETWRSGCTWDQQIHDDQYSKWLTWLRLLPNVEAMKIPRCYVKSEFCCFPNMELHTFVDASEDGFAAVSYLRCSDADIISCVLLGSKTRVAPLKMMSVPRLELQAAVLGARLARTLIASHSVNISNVTFWSDSRTVLSWLRSDHRRYSQFVAFRISEILELTDLSNWRWLPTTENVVDEATKWQRIPDFSSSSRWLNGPAFLKQDPSLWPRERSGSDTHTDEELRAQYVGVHMTGKTEKSHLSMQPERFSTWKKLLQITAAVIHIAHVWRDKVHRYHHANHETVVNEIRQKIWIPRLRAILNKVRRSCQNCKNHRAQPSPPKMSLLPLTRVAAFCRPFTYVGVDYFGPMFVSVRRSSEKRYGVLLTCLTTRAIHLEVAYSLSTDSCIIAIRNFIARRGSPLEPVSDGIQLRRSWQTSQQLANAFWKRWVREYLPVITRRCKWIDDVKQIEVDDIAYIVDPDGPRNCWPKGRIVEIKKSANGRVRSALVKTAAGLYTRPATKIAVLDIRRPKDEVSPQKDVPGGSVATDLATSEAGE